MAAIAIPAFIALLSKVFLLVYALRSPRRDPTTRLFIMLLGLFALQNLVEWLGLDHFATRGLDRTMELFGFAYFAATIPFIAATLHVSLRLSIDDWAKVKRVVPLLYLPALLLEFLLLGTDQLVAGFQLFKNYTILRVPGPLYFLFEVYVPLYVLAALVYVIYGARTSRPSRINRIRNRWWLFALLPFVALHVYLIIANHFGLAKISSTISIPIALTFFFIVTTYATHQYRLFDIEFLIPWSRTRKRKTEFYRRIQATIAEIAEMHSVKEVLNSIANTLRCQVALVGGLRPQVAFVDGQELVIDDDSPPSFPREALKNVKHIVVTNEVAERQPELYELMKRYKVGAIVPFNAHSPVSPHWMLLGEHFSNQVYTPLDFKFVETLFDRLAERFLDNLMLLRSQLEDAQADNLEFQLRLSAAWAEVNALRQKVMLAEMEIQRLREENTHWRRKSLRLVSSALPSAIIAGEASLWEYLSQCEAEVAKAAIESCDNDITRAADLLGISETDLQNIVQRYRLFASKQA
ncbi:MAG: histidine kinase N-terminal 7TM domain-containing protein [Sulfurifustis sp.]